MKVLFISSWFPNRLETTNGNFVQRHAEAVSTLHDVEVLHAIGDFNQKEIFVFDEKVINGIRTLIIYYKNSKNPIQNFIRRMKAYKMGFEKMRTPDIVHANVLHNNMLFAIYIKRKYKIPYVVSEHWSGFLKINRSKLSFTTLFIARTIAKKASYLLPVSRDLKEDLEKLELGKNFKVVGNVVDTKVFYPAVSQRNVFTFLHISNLIPLKNPDLMIEAAIRLRKEYENFEFHIGGDGDVARLNNIIEKHNAQDFIKTFGEISHKDVAEKMRNSDCFILFSDYENLPCVLLESISSGTPVIATRVGGIPEIINENQGILINRSTEELYLAMKNMLTRNINVDSPEQLHQYILDNFSVSTVAKDFSEVYNSVL